MSATSARTDGAGARSALASLESKTVADVMTRELITLDENESLTGLEERMDQLLLRHLPVVRGRKLVGLVSHRDVLRFGLTSLWPSPVSAAATQRVAANTFVRDIMTRDVETVVPRTPLGEAARRLVHHKFGCLPVVDDGLLVGIVTEHDLLQGFVRALDASALP